MFIFFFCLACCGHLREAVVQNFALRWIGERAKFRRQ